MNKFCFIACFNNLILLQECIEYIERLYIPAGYEVETFLIGDAASMAEGYNRAIVSSDAKYKIYLHQDLFIVNRYFLYNILNIFEADDSISMIGMMGSPILPDNAIMWNGHRVGKLWNETAPESYDESIDELSFTEVAAVDGAIMVTSKDIRWRDDIFDGFDFYDVSQSLEHRRKGYKVVVPKQISAWCIHDDGVIMNLMGYEPNRQKLLKEYSKEEFVVASNLSKYGDNYINLEAASDYVIKLENVNRLSSKLSAKAEDIYKMIDEKLSEHNMEGFISIGNIIMNAVSNDEILYSSDFVKIISVIKAVSYEKSLEDTTFMSDISSLSKLQDKYDRLASLLWRIEVCPAEDWTFEAFKFIDENDISAFMISEILYSKISLYRKRKFILDSIAVYFKCKNDMKRYARFMAVSSKYEEGNNKV